MGIVLPVVYGCTSWSLTLREERRLRVCENRVLRGIFGAKRDEVTEEWRKLHNEELNDLYCSPNIVRVIKIEKNEMGKECSTYGERRGVCGGLVGKPEGRRPIVRSRLDGRIILRWISSQWGAGIWTGLIWLRIWTDGGHL